MLIRIYDLRRAFYIIRLRRSKIGVNIGGKSLSSGRMIFGLAVGPAALKQALTIILDKTSTEGCKPIRFGDWRK